MLSWVRKYNSCCSNEISKCEVVFVHERRTACCHFVDQDAKSPPINCEPMAALVKNFGCNVLSCSAEGVGFLSLVFEELGETEVSQVYITCLIDQNVLWFQVSMDYIVVV